MTYFRVNLLSFEISVLVPITTTEYITYANAYCAICHGESEFNFWNLHISNVSECFATALKNNELLGFALDPIAWLESGNKSLCSIEGRASPGPPEMLKNWLSSKRKSNDMMNTTSRFSKYCLNDDYFLSCEEGSMEVGNVDESMFESKGRQDLHRTNSNIYHTEISNSTFCPTSYQICQDGTVDVRYGRCTVCSKETKCYSQFPNSMLFGVLVGVSQRPMRPKPLVLLLSLILDRAGDTKWEYKYMRNVQYLRMSQCSNTSTCDSVNSTECEVNRTESDCLIPNPLMAVCHALPCKMAERDQCERACQKTGRDVNWKYSFFEYLLLGSVVCLIVTMLLFLFVPELRTKVSFYQLNHYFCNIFSDIFLFVSGYVGVSPSKGVCIFSAMFLHYALTSYFAWMTIINFLLLKKFYTLQNQIANVAQNGVSNVGITTKKMILSVFCGHGIPGIFVLFCTSLDFLFQPGFVAYGQGQFCWINHPQGLLTVFILPTGILMIFNFLCFFVCSIYLISFFVNNGAISTQSYMFFVAMKLLLGSGIQWLFGVVTHFRPTNATVRFIFVTLVSSHGILVVLSTLLQRVVRRSIFQFLKSKFL